MPKLRIFYITSLVILGALLVFAVWHPFAPGDNFTEVQRTQLLETEDEWIIQFDIINREGKDANYTIEALLGGKAYTENVLIGDGRIFTYIHHIYRDTMSTSDASFIIYKEGEDKPLEEVTYYLK